MEKHVGRANFSNLIANLLTLYIVDFNKPSVTRTHTDLDLSMSYSFLCYCLENVLNKDFPFVTTCYTFLAACFTPPDKNT